MSMSCQICVEPLNKSNHSPSTCNHCGLIACKTCIRTYMNSSSESHCMKCKVAWEDEFVLKAVNKTYFHSELKEKKKDRYVEFEKSRLPATQIPAKHFLIKENMMKEINKIEVENDELIKKINSNKKIIRKIRENTRQELGIDVVERKEFIMRCQVSGCKGFLSTGYKCELCSSLTCPKCLEVIEQGHECKAENIASAEMIKKETKPCPKCSTRIHKIDGCNQMWCTSCNTPWDWPTGKIVNGTVHNPHYYDYLKTQNTIVPRNPGDVVCGGIPDIYLLQTEFLRFLPPVFKDVCQFIRNSIYSMHRLLVDTRFKIIDFNQRDHFETNLTTVRIKYMLNRTTEDEFRQQIYNINYKRDKARENIRLLELIQTVGTDLMQNYYKLFEENLTTTILFDETCKLINEFNELLSYYETLRLKKFNMFKQSGVIFNVKQLPIHEGPIEITDKFIYSSSGQI